GGRPFPDIADHLPAAEGAVALGTSRNVERSVEHKIQICMLARRCSAAPRPGPLHAGEATAVRARLSNRRRFPLRLGRQSAPGKAAPSLGLVPVDENNRSVRSEKFGAIVPAPCPDAVGFRLPVYRTFSTLTFSPCPAIIAPKFTNAVTAGLNKRCKFAIGDRRASNAERAQFDFVR